MEMSDYISREEALDVVNGWRDQLIPTYGKNDEYVKCLETVAEHLESLPTADVRPVRRGKWIKCRKNYSKCSECGTAYSHPVDWTPDKYCSECGARLFMED